MQEICLDAPAGVARTGLERSTLGSVEAFTLKIGEYLSEMLYEVSSVFSFEVNYLKFLNSYWNKSFEIFEYYYTDVNDVYCFDTTAMTLSDLNIYVDYYAITPIIAQIGFAQYYQIRAAYIGYRSSAG